MIKSEDIHVGSFLFSRHIDEANNTWFYYIVTQIKILNNKTVYTLETIFKIDKTSNDCVTVFSNMIQGLWFIEIRNENMIVYGKKDVIKDFFEATNKSPKIYRIDRT